MGITGDHSARVAVRGGVGCVRRWATGQVAERSDRAEWRLGAVRGRLGDVLGAVYGAALWGHV